MFNAALVGNPDMIDHVYGSGRKDEIAARTRLSPSTIASQSLLDNPSLAEGIEIVFSTWGMPRLESDHLDRLPHLKAVFYAAGSVQWFGRPLLERGIILVSAWRANAKSVAQFTVAQILLAAKGYFRNARIFDGSSESMQSAFRGPGAYHEAVALLGAGAIGRQVIELLRPFDLRILLFDPFLSNSDAGALGVELVSIEDTFSRALVVSNHLADKPETVSLIHRALLASMRPDSTFINTGRGKTVSTTDLISVCAERPDLTALLDVTDPEPPGADSPLIALPNVHVTSHIAGAIGNEVLRLADLCIAEFDRYAAGHPLHHAVTLEAFERLA